MGINEILEKKSPANVLSMSLDAYKTLKIQALEDELWGITLHCGGVYCPSYYLAILILALQSPFSSVMMEVNYTQILPEKSSYS